MIEFEVKGDEKIIKLSPGDLFDILSSKINVKESKTEFDVLNQKLYESLEKTQIVTPLLNKNLFLNILYISFSLGYYYRLFLEKNNVNITTPEEGENEIST